MTPREFITGILEGLVTEGGLAEYHYATPTQHNVSLSYGSTPAALFSVITDRVVDIAGGSARCRATVVVDFVTDSGNATTDFDADEMEEKIDDMGNVAISFISAVRSAIEYEIIGNEVSVLSLYDFRDRNTTGVRVRMTIKEVYGVCFS